MRRGRRAARAHPVRRRIAAAIKVSRPWTCATAALHEHLRLARAAVPVGIRGARIARRALVVLGAAVESRSTFDSRGSAREILGDLGITASDRAARETVRILSGLGVIVDASAGHNTPSRIRLRAALLAAVDRAGLAPITPQVFDASAGLLGDPEQLCFPWTGSCRIRDPRADSLGVRPYIERARAEALEIRTMSSWLWSVPNRPRLRQAACLLLDFGAPTGVHGGALARALLEAAGQPSGHRAVEAVARALASLQRLGLLRLDRHGAVAPDADPHPDLVALGIDLPADARPCSKAMQAHLARLGVVRPDLLGHVEACALQRALRARRRSPDPLAAEQLTLPELRVAAGHPPVATPAYVANMAAVSRSYTACTVLAEHQRMDHAQLGALVRARRESPCPAARPGGHDAAPHDQTRPHPHQHHDRARQPPP